MATGTRSEITAGGENENAEMTTDNVYFSRCDAAAVPDNLFSTLPPNVSLLSSSNSQLPLPLFRPS